jgi:uncharacterized OsmC-like protein
MGTVVSGRYLGDKRVTMTHLASSAELITDAPKDNNGQGRSFSPTDLVAAALGSCVLTTIAIVAERAGVSIAGSYFEVGKVMGENPRRFVEIPVVVHLPRAIAEHERPRLERAGLGCPVHQSLHSEVRSVITFLYDAE